MTLDERIIKIPDPRLRIRWPEDSLDISAATLEKMLGWSADHANYGWGNLAGLSSIQVTEPGRVITWSTLNGWDGCIDPVVVERSYEHDVRTEGCYSIHDVWVRVKRPRYVTIKGTDLDFNETLYKLQTSSAGYALHELDHLDGILITDYQIDNPESIDVGYSHGSEE